jgi:glycosyltransferase involved in cell wall biosynthesis
MRKIKVNVLSPGRFHVCDLSRELAKQGFDVKFYSFVPTRRAMKFGLPRECSVSLTLPMLPFLALERKILPHAQWTHTLCTKAQDVLTAMVMRKCDVCIAMSGSFVYAPKRAKKQGAIFITERGSKHILEQKRILEEEIPANRGKCIVPLQNVKRELACYELADYIAIATEHVERSLLQHDIPRSKIFRNPYGVDVSMFRPLPEVAKTYDVIMVGGWGYRKGCDLIVEALRDSNLKFLHVGSLVDMAFPELPNFTHVNSVDQTQLIHYYNQAKVFVLPSREEGLAMVQAQAIACNLPLIGSRDSGAEDLKKMVSNPEYVTIIEDYTPASVLKAIRLALEQYEHMGDTVYAGDAIKNLTWEAYGERYAAFLRKILER